MTSADPDEYSPSVRSDPGPYRGSSRTTTNAMGLPLRKKKPSSPFPRGKLLTQIHINLQKKIEYLSQIICYIFRKDFMPKETTQIPVKHFIG